MAWASVDTFTSAQAFLDADRAAAAGCVVLDVAMPGLGGLALQQALAACGSHLPIVFLTGHGDIDMGVQAMKVGAADFLTKPVDDARLIDAVANAIERNRLALRASAEVDEIRLRLATLTAREREVLALVAEGLPNKLIARRLEISEKTVKAHLTSVFRQIGADDRTQAALWAVRNGMSGDPGAGS